MAIFNETFTDDKPIYYPSNWQTGKTAGQLYQQWKLTTQYFLLSNFFQCLLAGLWICFIVVICYAIKHMWRLYNLDDTKREKIQNRHYINQNSIMSTFFLAFIAFSVTIALCLLNQFTRYALVKGFVSCALIFSVVKSYQKGKTLYRQYKINKNNYQKIKKDEQSQ